MINLNAYTTTERVGMVLLEGSAGSIASLTPAEARALARELEEAAAHASAQRQQLGSAKPWWVDHITTSAQA